MHLYNNNNNHGELVTEIRGLRVKHSGPPSEEQEKKQLFVTNAAQNIYDAAKSTGILVGF